MERLQSVLNSAFKVWGIVACVKKIPKLNTTWGGPGLVVSLTTSKCLNELYIIKKWALYN